MAAGWNVYHGGVYYQYPRQQRSTHMKLLETTGTLGLDITGMTCGHCISRVTRTLSAIPGLAVADVRIGGATVTVSDAGALPQAVAALADLGYTATVVEARPIKTARACCGGSGCCG
jgi:copper chaperone